MSIWEECNGAKRSLSLTLEPWRIVEAQHISSSRDLVDTKEEHELLEEMLEFSKPPIVPKKHYLITTPFRYPPLEYGSRFGRIFEPSLWYGALKLTTALAEAAFYRLKFFADTHASLGFIEIPMTAFKVYLHTLKGIDLTAPPFITYQGQISHPSSYEYSQPLGTSMREAGMGAFIFTSARDKKEGKNVGVFSVESFKAKNGHYITHMQNWRSIANKEVIEFSRDGLLSQEQHIFRQEDFAL